MGNFIFKVTDKPRFIINGMVAANNFENIDMQKTVTEFILCDKQIKAEYSKSIDSGMKLIGQEKASLLKLLEKLVVEIITFRLYIEQKNNESRTMKCSNSISGYEFHISRSKYEFSITGFFSMKKLNEIHSFHKWHVSTFSLLQEKLLNTIKSKLADRSMSRDESNEICQQLDEILHIVILMYYKLESDNIFI